jgi:hypothetical protein
VAGRQPPASSYLRVEAAAPPGATVVSRRWPGATVQSTGAACRLAKLADVPARSSRSLVTVPDPGHAPIGFTGS